MVSVTIGLMIDQQLLKTMPFVNDPSIIVKTVHTTCERCGIKDCKERAVRPVVIEKQEEQEKINKSLTVLDEF